MGADAVRVEEVGPRPRVPAGSGGCCCSCACARAGRGVAERRGRGRGAAAHQLMAVVRYFIGNEALGYGLA